jgi:septal ring factor EnvC (AmiA/AmiB activator)
MQCSFHCHFINTNHKTMMRVIFLFSLFYFNAITIFAQTRGELEKQRLQLKKEIEDAQKLLGNVKAETKQTLSTISIYNNKANLQEKVMGTIEKDLNILDNNIYGLQRDLNRYDKLLDTLKQEYAKSMVYAYKNRGNYEFLNFIFSADNFNDAVKRIAYLKSYRTYREMQGQNIMRTQELRRNKLEDLGVSKQHKKVTLDVKAEELKKIEEQKAVQAKIAEQLKRKGSELNASIAANQKQVAKVNAAIKAAIAKAIKEEKERRLAAEKAAKKKREELAAAAAAAEKIRKAEEAKKIKANPTPGKPTETITTKTPVKEARATKAPKEAPESVDLNSESVALNSSFERNKGNLPWPVDNGGVLNHYGPISLPSGATLNNSAVTISASIGTQVKAVFDGVVILIVEIDDGKFLVTIKHGNYYTSYSNINNVTVKKDQAVSARQVIGKVASNFDGIGVVDFQCARELTELNPEKWLRSR